MTYLRFTNGAVEQLVSINNEVAQNECIDNGFWMLTDEDGTPSLVDSSELVKSKKDNRAELLKAIQQKLSAKSNINKRRA